MSTTTPVLNLNSLMEDDENYILGVEGALRLNFIDDTLYNLFPYFFHGNHPPHTKHTHFIRAVLAVTDKRIILARRTSKSTFDRSSLHSYNFKNIEITPKKVMGSSLFILDRKKEKVFNFVHDRVIFEVNPRFAEEAEKIEKLITSSNL